VLQARLHRAIEMARERMQTSLLQNAGDQE